MGKKDRVFLVFMVIIFLNVQLRTNSKPFYLSTTPGYVKGKFVIPFPKLRQRQKASTWISHRNINNKKIGHSVACQVELFNKKN